MITRIFNVCIENGKLYEKYNRRNVWVDTGDYINFL